MRLHRPHDFGAFPTTEHGTYITGLCILLLCAHPALGCDLDTGGWCYFTVCYEKRGPTTCTNSRCTCVAGYCAVDGTCKNLTAGDLTVGNSPTAGNLTVGSSLTVGNSQPAKNEGLWATAVVVCFVCLFLRLVAFICIFGCGLRQLEKESCADGVMFLCFIDIFLSVYCCFCCCCCCPCICKCVASIKDGDTGAAGKADVEAV